MSVSRSSETEAIWHVPARLHLELLALLSADPTKPATMTYDAFLAWADEERLALAAILGWDWLGEAISHEIGCERPRASVAIVSGDAPYGWLA